MDAASKLNAETTCYEIFMRFLPRGRVPTRPTSHLVLANRVKVVGLAASTRSRGNVADLEAFDAVPSSLRSRRCIAWSNMTWSRLEAAQPADVEA